VTGSVTGPVNGTLPALVMIHGLLGSSSFYSPQQFLPQLDVHTPDLLGYGSRRTVEQGVDLDGQASHIVRILREEVGRPAWLLGHSVGGAVMMLAAQQAPELVAGLITVEGNFTLKDAFWCTRIAAMPEADWAAEYGAMEDDPAGWLERSGIEASDQRIAWAKEILANQPYVSIQAMARSVVSVTAAPAYLEGVRRVLGSGVPLYLLGGELSAAGWDIPEWVLALACRSQVQPKAGHMMMLEDPAAFCGMVGEIVGGHAARTQG